MTNTIKFITFTLLGSFILPTVGQNNIGGVVKADLSIVSEIGAELPKKTSKKLILKKKEAQNINPFKKYATGLEFKSNQDIFRIMPGVFVAPSKSNISNNNITLNSSNSDITIIGTKGSTNIFIRNNDLLGVAKTQSTNSIKSTTAPLPNERMVVYNTRTKNAGIVMGTIIVGYNNADDLADFEKEYNIKLVSNFKSIHYAFFTPLKIIEIFSITNNLQRDNRVKTAEVEILENIQLPN